MTMRLVLSGCLAMLLLVGCASARWRDPNDGDPDFLARRSVCLDRANEAKAKASGAYVYFGLDPIGAGFMLIGLAIEGIRLEAQQKSREALDRLYDQCMAE